MQPTMNDTDQAETDIHDFIEVCRLLGWSAHVLKNRVTKKPVFEGQILFDIRTETRLVQQPITPEALHDRGIWPYLIHVLHGELSVR